MLATSNAPLVKTLGVVWRSLYNIVKHHFKSLSCTSFHPGYPDSDITPQTNYLKINLPA
ncbi:hypothetical protein [Aphanizomenon flos-aquae]|uniref:hypothetical protein n=1 Tax=Aphanizomenon flos-aquae TaxID=1176 RepID=UPI000A8023ED|nr:hypothetical protein [Aphanizomenon flos-aquae]